MSFNKEQFKDLVVEVLEPVELASPAAINLLLGTVAVESQFGRYLKQLGKGPALGVFQMEPATHDDIWKNYLRYNVDLADHVISYVPDEFIEAKSGMDVPLPSILRWNLAYAILMCRVHYRRVPSALPEAHDIDGLARYWKRHYNTVLGAGTEQGFVNAYKRYVL